MLFSVCALSLSLFARCAAQHLVQLSALTIYGKKEVVMMLLLLIWREKKRMVSIYLGLFHAVAVFSLAFVDIVRRHVLRF